MRTEDRGDSLEDLNGRVSDNDICDAYLYLLGRLFVLQQEHMDTRSIGFRWNALTHREVGSVGWSRPCPDIACSDGWIAVDQKSCTVIEVPPIVERYYTVHVLNAWGETIANLNERNLPEHPWGRFAFCLAGSTIDLPAGTHRIDMRGKKARVFAQFETGKDVREAVELQHRFAMHATGTPSIEPPIDMFVFTNDTLPGVESLELAAAVLESDPDINPNVELIQNKLRAVAVAAENPTQRAHIDAVIRAQAVPLLRERVATLGSNVNGWRTYRTAGKYGDDWLMRTTVNLHSIWANISNEVMRSETRVPLDGGRSYTLTLNKADLPESHAQYWSVSALDSLTFRVLPNRQNCFLLGKHSPLQFANDGSLTLYFGPHVPADAPIANWLPTLPDRSYILEWRSYGPDRATLVGRWHVPPVVLHDAEDGAPTRGTRGSVASPARGSRALVDLSDEDASELAVEAYTYAYPLVLMEITRRVSTNVEAVAGGKAPMNCLAHRHTAPDASYADVVCPTADCLTSALWFDVSHAPLIFRVPESNGRYYVLSLLDMWSEVFAAIGPRTTGDGAQAFALVGPRWRGMLPRGMAELRAPTDHGWMIVAVATHGEDDHPAVHAFQNGMSTWTLNRYGRSLEPRGGKIDTTMDMDAPAEQVRRMEYVAFFELFGKLTQRNPPHVHDQPVLARMRRLGLETGKLFNPDSISPVARDALSLAPAIARRRIERDITDTARTVNGWRINEEPIGVYGADYLRRASVARVRLGAMLADDVLSMTLVSDDEDAPLDGARSYSLHFEHEQLPPCRAFWSLTAYTERYRLAKNASGRHSIRDLDALRINHDGSLDVHIQRDDPGVDLRSNWLPSPRQGPYSVMLRVYWPTTAAVNGRWSPPSLMRHERLTEEVLL